MHDGLLQAIFYIFSGLAIIAALLVVTQNNPVRCVLFLVLAFFASTVLWILVKAEFLALILILVYVGAVMTLFLFVVMMLNIDIESMRKHFLRYVPFGLILVALLTSLLLVAIPRNFFDTGTEVSVAINQVVEGIDIDETPSTIPKQHQELSNTERLGMVLYTNYVFAFELAAVILLVAIVAAITLVHRAPIRSKRQNIVEQIMTRRDERVELIKMKPETNK
jgi:NADH-quinone oxidoreductase subunit J